MARKVLIVEDDPDIAALVAMSLRDIDCHCEIAIDGPKGLTRWQEAAKTVPFDLAVLDVMLPGMDGLEICRTIRRAENYMPVLMLTAKSSELDRVLGLEIGADDYLTKPFSIPELQARIKALFRRVEAFSNKSENSQNETRIFEHKDLRLDLDRHQVFIKDKPVDLTAREFELLHHFASNPDHVYSRAQLLDTVWGYNHDGYEHTVNTHINRLRAKIEEDPAKPVYIQTVWGVGYKFGAG
ncbi:MAG: response regulator transcription factor [Hyphomicrobiaceae bacterium]|nr:response regulator transcription factor [Hyphomicrobiaceae bacterium]